MDRRILAIVIFLPTVGLIGLLAWAMFQAKGTPGGFGINNEFGPVAVVERPAPSMTLPLLSGDNLFITDLTGKIVMLDFWSSWCAPCIAEAATLADVYSDYSGRGVEFVGIAIWDESEAVLDHVARFAVPYPNGHDDMGRIAIDYGVRGMPEKFFIDRDGMLIEKHVGPASEEALRSILDRLLKKANG